MLIGVNQRVSDASRRSGAPRALMRRNDSALADEVLTNAESTNEERKLERVKPKVEVCTEGRHSYLLG